MALLVSLLTLFAVMRVWSEVFWKPAPAEAAPLSEDSTATGSRLSPFAIVPMVLLAGLTLALGLGGEFVFQLAEQASAQLLDTRAYLDTVLP